MKKPLIIALLFAAAAAVLIYALWPQTSREQLVCEKLVALCGSRASRPRPA